MILSTYKALNSLEMNLLSMDCMTCFYIRLYDIFEVLKDEPLSVGCTCPYADKGFLSTHESQNGLPILARMRKAR